MDVCLCHYRDSRWWDFNQSSWRNSSFNSSSSRSPGPATCECLCGSSFSSVALEMQDEALMLGPRTERSGYAKCGISTFSRNFKGNLIGAWLPVVTSNLKVLLPWLCAQPSCKFSFLTAVWFLFTGARTVSCPGVAFTEWCCCKLLSRHWFVLRTDFTVHSKNRLFSAGKTMHVVRVCQGLKVILMRPWLSCTQMFQSRLESPPFPFSLNPPWWWWRWSGFASASLLWHWQGVHLSLCPLPSL